MLLRDQLYCIGASTRRNLLRQQVLLSKPTRGLRQRHAGALKAADPACMFPIERVMAAQRTEADHATPFFPLWRPSTTLTGIGVGLAMLFMVMEELSVDQSCRFIGVEEQLRDMNKILKRAKAKAIANNGQHVRAKASAKATAKANALAKAAVKRAHHQETLVLAQAAADAVSEPKKARLQSAPSIWIYVTWCR